jgi:hypothetical protein
MTTPMILLNDHCPTEETLAAFVDDRLDAATRRKVTEHLAACGDCRELVLMASEYQASEAPSNVTQAAHRFAPWRWTAAAAAAAVIVVFVLRPSPLFAPDMSDVIAAVRQDKRPFDGRLAAFPYAQRAKVMRGDTPEPLDSNVKLLDIAGDLEDATAPDPHVKGVTALFVENYADPVAELKKAYETSSGEKRDAAAIDYAVALIARGDDQQHDDERALELSEEVLKRTKRPEAAWNRAVALSNLGRDQLAIRAWDDYLKLDSASPWAAEAKRKRELLMPQPPQESAR